MNVNAWWACGKWIVDRRTPLVNNCPRLEYSAAQPATTSLTRRPCCVYHATPAAAPPSRPLFRARLPRWCQTRTRKSRDARTTLGDWPLRSLDTTIEDLFPPQVMDLIQGWFLRSVRRDSVTENPVLAIERLSSLPRPLDDEGKEMLVGAMLTMSSSLHLALGMLREVLPQDKSQDRLAEVLCPTLGHLLASVQSTISSFNPKGCQQQVIEALPPPSAQPTTTQQTPPRSPRDIPKPQSLEQSRPPSTPRDGQKKLGRLPVGDATTSPPASTTQPRQFDTFPPLEHRGAAAQSRSEVDVPQRPEARLVKALQAEMRVQAAIHVAVESLEFAEGQLQIVREVNQLHGGGK